MTELHESDRAAELRRDSAPKHTVIGFVEREHSMNGRPCENPWAVIRFYRTGNIGFACGPCRVTHHGGPGYDELMELWGGEQDTNPNANGYPPDHISHASFKAYLKAGWGPYHVPPDRMGGNYATEDSA